MPATLLILSAPSGTGKTTLARRLVAAHPGAIFSVSYTTRAPRDGEKDEVDYHFVSEERFKGVNQQAVVGQASECGGRKSNDLGFVGAVEAQYAGGLDTRLLQNGQIIKKKDVGRRDTAKCRGIAHDDSFLGAGGDVMRSGGEQQRAAL